MSNLDYITLFIVFYFGAIFGSFANVVIYRLPKGESIVKPRSHCKKCNKMISWYDNIPIFSWFLLKGKCRHCHDKISIRYPLVEFLMGLSFLLSFIFSSNWIYFIEWCLFSFAAITSSFIDLDHMILPDEFTLSGIVIGLIGAVINPERSFIESLLGVLIGGGFLWAMAYLYLLFTKQDGMGGGDIKLLAWIGAVLGWKAVPFVIMFSAVFGSVVGLIAARKTEAGLKTVIPFGPYLVLGGLVYMFGGQSIGLWYLGLFLPEFSQ